MYHLPIQQKNQPSPELCLHAQSYSSPPPLTDRREDCPDFSLSRKVATSTMENSTAARSTFTTIAPMCCGKPPPLYFTRMTCVEVQCVKGDDTLSSHIEQDISTTSTSTTTTTTTTLTPLRTLPSETNNPVASHDSLTNTKTQPPVVDHLKPSEEDQHPKSSKIIQLSKEEIEKYFSFPQPTAAKLLKVSLSTLKRRFYETHRGSRWPYSGIKKQAKKRSIPFIVNPKNKPVKLLDPHTLHTLKKAFADSMNSSRKS